MFEAGGADLMAGQQWFGQLEGRIQKTVEELAVVQEAHLVHPRHPADRTSGTHQGQAASILDQILPAIAAGPADRVDRGLAAVTARLLRLRPALRGTLEVVAHGAAVAEETLELGAQPGASGSSRRPTSRSIPTASTVALELGAAISERARASRAPCSIC